MPKAELPDQEKLKGELVPLARTEDGSTSRSGYNHTLQPALFRFSSAQAASTHARGAGP